MEPTTSQGILAVQLCSIMATRVTYSEADIMHTYTNGWGPDYISPTKLNQLLFDVDYVLSDGSVID